MSNQNVAATSPTFEDLIREKLTGRTRENALDYVAFVKSIGIPGGSVFHVPGGYLCNIHQVDETGWKISMEHTDSPLCRREYQDFPVDEKVREFAWAHVSTCKGCGCGFNPGRRATLFGKAFRNTCFGLMDFENPDGEDLELLKKLTVVWKQVIDDAAGKGTLYARELYEPGGNEWFPAVHTDERAGRPLGKAYTKSLNVEFFITTKKTFITPTTIGFSSGGLSSAGPQNFPAALGIGAHHYDRFEAYKGPSEGYACAEILRHQVDVTYLAEMSLNITDNTYDVTMWMLDAGGRPDAPYYIAKDFPFRSEAGAPPVTAIDTVYPVCAWGDGECVIIRDFRVVGGE